MPLGPGTGSSCTRPGHGTRSGRIVRRRHRNLDCVVPKRPPVALIAITRSRIVEWFSKIRLADRRWAMKKARIARELIDCVLPAYGRWLRQRRQMHASAASLNDDVQGQATKILGAQEVA